MEVTSLDYLPVNELDEEDNECVFEDLEPEKYKIIADISYIKRELCGFIYQICQQRSYV